MNAHAGAPAIVSRESNVAEVAAALPADIAIDAARAPAMIGTEASIDGATAMVGGSAPVGAFGAQDAATTTTTETAPATYTDSTSENRDYTAYIVGGVLLAGGIIALAASGGGDDDDSSTPTPTPTPTNTAPTFTSATTATIAENAPVSTVVIDVNATDAQNNSITYSLGGADAGLFSINASSGEVTLRSSADFEARSSYSITVTATDNATPALSASQNITVTVTNVNEAPAFATATATATVAENVATTAVVFDANATDPDANTTLTYSLGGTDAAAFTIDSATGEVRFRASPDFEARTSYSFTVTASDGATPALTATQTVTVNVTDVAENGAPVFTSAATATIAENSAAATVILDANATDPEGNEITYSITGADAAAFTIDAATGELRLNQPADFETQASYSLNIVATDNGTPAASTAQAVTITVTDINEARVDIDGGTIPATVSQTFDAATGNLTFVENAAEGNLTVLTGFATGDVIVTDVATGRYSFSSVGDDLVISLNNNGVVTSITLQDAVSTNAFIFNEASAEAAVGFDFFQSSIPPAPPASNTLDGPGVPAVFDASLAANTYTERAGVTNNTTINGFTADDRIVVNGTAGDSTATRYSFSSTDNDLTISFNQGGISSRIVITDVVSPNAFIFDEASAERAIGFDFFSYA